MSDLMPSVKELSRSARFWYRVHVQLNRLAFWRPARPIRRLVWPFHDLAAHDPLRSRCSSCQRRKANADVKAEARAAQPLGNGPFRPDPALPPEDAPVAAFDGPCLHPETTCTSCGMGMTALTRPHAPGCHNADCDLPFDHPGRCWYKPDEWSCSCGWAGDGSAARRTREDWIQHQFGRSPQSHVGRVAALPPAAALALPPEDAAVELLAEALRGLTRGPALETARIALRESPRLRAALAVPPATFRIVHQDRCTTSPCICGPGWPYARGVGAAPPEPPPFIASGTVLYPGDSARIGHNGTGSQSITVRVAPPRRAAE